MVKLDVCAGRFCPLCGDVGRLAFDKDAYHLRECRGEAVGRSHPPVLLSWLWRSETEYDRLYLEDLNYHNAVQRAGGQVPFDGREEELARAAHSRMRHLEPFVSPGASICDVGAAYGMQSLIACAMGYTAFSLEPNPMVVSVARAVGRRIEVGTWRDVKGNWDVITLFDVFEHLTRPRACLRHLVNCLTPAGVILLEMPEWDAGNSRCMKHVRPEQHPVLYSAGAAEQLFSEEGLRVLEFHRPVRGELGKMSWLLMRSEVE